MSSMSLTKKTTLRIAGMAAIAAAVVTLAGCNGDGIGNGDTTVTVAEREFVLTVSPTDVASGHVTFDIHNVGTVTHEFLVVQTSLDAAALPTGIYGSYDENGPGTTIVDQEEDIHPGESRTLTVDLAPGHYVLLCNMVVGTSSHYHNGMRVNFHVE